MVNLEHNLTVDDLIVEYMMYKVKNGYEPSFLTSEFISFLYFFESKMPVVDSIYENDKLFTRFFERKSESDWSRTVSWITKEKETAPHMDMVYSEKNNDYLIRANYKLGDFDRSVINTYFMPGGQFGEGKVKEIRNIIGEYLSNQQKRQLDESVEIDNNDLIIGQYVSAEIVVNICESYIKKMIENHRWPRQCSDINKYLFQKDLSEIIGVESIKNDLIELFNEFSKRIAILYHQDKNLRISTHTNDYLARANYDLLIQGYEKIMITTFGQYNKSFDVDLSNSTFTESHELDGIYDWDEDPDVSVTTNKIGNDNVKKIVRNLKKI